MRTDEQMTTIVTRAMQELHKDSARKWGFPPRVLAGATFGLGITLMHESGYSEEQLLKIVRQFVADLSAPPRVLGDLTPRGGGTP